MISITKASPFLPRGLYGLGYGTFLKHYAIKIFGENKK